ncbi:hypothetical protein GGH12_003092 [Coemansia sp. RSA 1822]|nr:hypothetical protein GGH12_003092 [Coemansia sp. RSA 1822]
MTHLVFGNSNVVLQIVKESFDIQYGLDEWQYRAEYLAHISKLSARGVGRVQSLVMSLEENMHPGQVSACLRESGFCRQPWPRIKDICIRLTARADSVPQNPTLSAIALVSQVVFEHAPYSQGFYIASDRAAREGSTLPMYRILQEQGSWIRRIRMPQCVRGAGVWPIDNLSALTMAIGSDLPAEQVPVVASRVIQILNLSNVEPHDIEKLLGSGSVLFESLRVLEIRFRTHTVTTVAHELDNDNVFLEFPRLETVRVYGFQQVAPLLLLRAIERAPVRHLYVDMTIQNMSTLDITRFPHLRTLEIALAFTRSLQPLLDMVFASSVCLERVVLEAHIVSDGQLPNSTRLRSLRYLKLEVQVCIEQIQPLMQSLCRLVELDVMMAFVPQYDRLITIEDAQGIVRKQRNTASTSLQVLRARYRRDICVGNMVSQLGADLVALLASFKSVLRFQCKDSRQNVQKLLDQMLADPGVMEVAQHLRGLDVSDAAEDPRAYGRLYEAIPLNSNPAKELFQHIIHNVVIRANKEPTLRSRLLPTSKTGSSRRSAGADPEIRRSIAYLTVLHGVVWSFPYTMNVLFTDQETCALLQRFVLSTALPLTVRETMLSMVSNWSVLYSKSLRARLNLEGIVDTVKEKVNLLPVQRLLPVPPVEWRQEGWHYPPQDPPEMSHVHQVQTHGSMPALTNSRNQALSPGSATFNTGPATDPVFLSQQRELMESFNGTRTPARPRVGSFPSTDNAITPEFTEHMLSSARELSSLCDMLTETLISLNVEEDPSTNPVVKDLMGDVKKRKDALGNFVGMLGQNHMDVLARLTETVDSVDRCLWLYDKTINSHNEWKAIQESLVTSNIHEQRAMADDDAYDAASLAARYAASVSSVSALASTSKVHSDTLRTVQSTGSYSSAYAGSPRPLPNPNMSSKARGKMPDMTMPNNANGYFGSDSAYGSGERSDNY